MALFLGLVISGGLTCLAGAVGEATWKMEHGPLQGPLINDLPKRTCDFLISIAMSAM